MLETVREFAAEALRESGQEEAVRRRHAEYLAGWTEEVMNGRIQLEGLSYARVEREYPNVSAALASALTLSLDDLLIRLCHSLTSFWHQSGRNEVSHQWMLTISDRLRPDPDTAGKEPERVSDTSRHEKFLKTQIWLRFTSEDTQGAAEASLEVFRIFERAGKAIEGKTDLFNAASYLISSDLRKSLELLKQCLPLEQAASVDGRGNPIILSRMAVVLRFSGQPEQASASLAEALFIGQRDRECDPQGFVCAQLTAGQAALARGDSVGALAPLEAGISVCRALENPLMTAYSLGSLATVARRTGDLDQAESLLKEAVVVAGAEPMLKIRLALRKEHSEQYLACGDIARASWLTRESLSFLRGRARGLRPNLYGQILLLAETELALPADASHGGRAARLMGAAEGVAARLGLRAPDHAEKERRNRLTACLTERIGADRLAREAGDGAAYDDEAALALALLPQ